MENEDITKIWNLATICRIIFQKGLNSDLLPNYYTDFIKFLLELQTQILNTPMVYQVKQSQ